MSRGLQPARPCYGEQSSLAIQCPRGLKPAALFSILRSQFSIHNGFDHHARKLSALCNCPLCKSRISSDGQCSRKALYTVSSSLAEQLFSTWITLPFTL